MHLKLPYFLVSIFLFCPYFSHADFSDQNSIYQFSPNNVKGESSSLKEYRGKVLLIVNTATQCGYTSQLAGLETLQQKYKDRGFIVLGFPSNDFNGQEPLENSQIAGYCQKNYGVTFPFFEKKPVTGSEIQPLYRFLTNGEQNGIEGTVQWNFEKFLIGRDGKVTNRFRSRVEPLNSALEKAVDALTLMSSKS